MNCFRCYFELILGIYKKCGNFVLCGFMVLRGCVCIYGVVEDGRCIFWVCMIFGLFVEVVY